MVSNVRRGFRLMLEPLRLCPRTYCYWNFFRSAGGKDWPIFRETEGLVGNRRGTIVLCSFLGENGVGR